MGDNGGTDATPRSRAFAWGVAGSCRAVLCSQQHFQIFIMSSLWSTPYFEDVSDSLELSNRSLAFATA